jgi:hypothetical protein
MTAVEGTELSLRVTFSDYTVWVIPAHVIADHRARYYATDESEEGNVVGYQKVYDEEYSRTVDDVYEIIDWASNNLKWPDVQEHAVKLRTDPPTVNYEDEWNNATMEVTSDV